MSEFEQEETQRLLGELLQGFLDCGDMIETLLSIENILTLVEKATVPIPKPSLDHERLLVIVAREYMGIHRNLEQQDFANGFLRSDPVEMDSKITVICHSSCAQNIEIYGRGKTAQENDFASFKCMYRMKTFLEQLHSINREEFHPLSSFDNVHL